VPSEALVARALRAARRCREEASRGLLGRLDGHATRGRHIDPADRRRSISGRRRGGSGSGLRLTLRLPALSRLNTLTVLEDVTVPRPRLAEMVDRIDAVAARHDLLIGTFGHAGDGNLHPTAVVDVRDPAAADRTHAAFAEIFAAALELDGTITGEHGVGHAKREYLSLEQSPAVIDLQRRLKNFFDPSGLLNPEKIFPAPDCS